MIAPEPIDEPGNSILDRVVDLDTALESCSVLVVLVDHDQFAAIPLAERSAAVVYDTRGIWPDQPRTIAGEERLRLVG